MGCFQKKYRQHHLLGQVNLDSPICLKLIVSPCPSESPSSTAPPQPGLLLLPHFNLLVYRGLSLCLSLQVIRSLDEYEMTYIYIMGFDDACQVWIITDGFLIAKSGENFHFTQTDTHRCPNIFSLHTTSLPLFWRLSSLIIWLRWKDSNQYRSCASIRKKSTIHTTIGGGSTIKLQRSNLLWHPI